MANSRSVVPSAPRPGPPCSAGQTKGGLFAFFTLCPRLGKRSFKPRRLALQPALFIATLACICCMDLCTPVSKVRRDISNFFREHNFCPKVYEKGSGNENCPPLPFFSHTNCSDTSFQYSRALMTAPPNGKGKWKIPPLCQAQNQ